MIEKVPLFVNEVVVVDNGSNDRTAEVACGSGLRWCPNQSGGMAGR